MYAELIEKENSMNIDTLRQLQAEHRSEVTEAERLHPGLVMPWENPAWTTIAAATPTHLADLITALEREQRVRELHAKGTFIFSWRDGLRFVPACPLCDGKAGIHECGCYADEDESNWKCQACGRESAYPCPTIRILDCPDDCETYKAFNTHAEALAGAIQETHRHQSGETESGEVEG